MSTAREHLVKRLEFLRDIYWSVLKLGVGIALATAIGSQLERVNGLHDAVYWSVYAAGVLGWVAWWCFMDTAHRDARRIERDLEIPPEASHAFVFPAHGAHRFVLAVPAVAMAMAALLRLTRP